MSVRKRAWTTSKGEKREAWVVDYVDAAGARHVKTFNRKRQADDYHASVRVDVSKGTHTAPHNSLTVEEAAENWIAYVKSEDRERSTTDQYEQHVRLHMKPRIGHMKLASLTAPMMEQLRDDLVRDRSRPMARKVLGSIKMLLKDAKRRGHVAQNVAADTRSKADKREKRKLKAGIDFPLFGEMHQMVDAAEGRSRALLLTAAFGGLRSSQIRGLRKSDVKREGVPFTAG